MHEVPYVATASILNIHVNKNSIFRLTKQLIDKDIRSQSLMNMIFKITLKL